MINYFMHSVIFKYVTILRAIGRMSWRMRLYMTRRMLRNFLAVRFPVWYVSRINKIKSIVPEFNSISDQRLFKGVLNIADFYCSEYRDLIDEACVGKLTLHGRTIDFGSPSQVDWTRSLPEEGDHQMWRVKLAHMGFICPMLAEGNASHHRAVISFIDGFKTCTSVTEPGAFGAWWFPYAVSHRILAIGAGLLVARQSGELNPEVDAVVSNFLRENTAFLLDNIEYELCNNHVERNLAALCLYFMGTKSVPIRVKRLLERDVTQILAATVLDDGTQAERSPMYQGLCVASLGVMADAPFLSDDLRASIVRKLDAAKSAFAMLCHPDGEVALFNDSWHAEVPRWVGPAFAEGRTLLPQGGYARLSAGLDVCLFDAGPLGPKWNAGHGHADFLSLELSLSGYRLVVDPGTSRYNTGPERKRERSAQAHNGPAWHAYEPVEFMDCFKIGRMAEARMLDDSVLSSLTVGGLLTTSCGTVARMIRHYPNLGFLVVDLWGHVSHQGQVTWLIPGHFQPDQAENTISINKKDIGFSAVIQLLIIDRVDLLEESHCASHYGRLDPAWSLRVYPVLTDRYQQSAIWIGHDPALPIIEVDAKTMVEDLVKITLSAP